MQASRTKLTVLGRIVTASLVAIASLTVSACQRNSGEIEQLKTENAALKSEIENLKKQLSGGDSPTGAEEVAVLNLTIDELWAQRFEDNRFRAKQRLDGKPVRLTGTVDSVDNNAVSLTGRTARIGTVNVLAKLNEAYARRIYEQLANVEKGREVTVQGNFQFEKMSLENATFVDRQTGKEIAPAVTPASENSAKKVTN